MKKRENAGAAEQCWTTGDEAGLLVRLNDDGWPEPPLTAGNIRISCYPLSIQDCPIWQGGSAASFIDRPSVYDVIPSPNAVCIELT